MKQMIANSEELIDLFKTLNFSEGQIRKLVLLYNRYKENADVFEDSYNHYYESMLKLGYRDAEIRELASTFPKAIFQKFEGGKLDDFYEIYIKSMVFSASSLDEQTKISMTKRNLKTLGLSDEKIDYILKSDLPIAEMDPEEVLDNIVFYLSNGMEAFELVESINQNATILLYGIREYAPLLELLTKIGFDQELFTHMVVMYAKNNTMLQPDVMYKTISWVLKKRFDNIKIVKYLKRHMIKNMCEEELEDAYNALIKLGFTEEQANYAISDNFSILYKPIEKYEYIIEIGASYGISKDQVISILTGFSSFSDLSDDKILEKIATVARYGLVDFVVNNPKNLIQGAELIDARATYLRMFHPRVSGKEFATDIFLDERIFSKKYNREKQYLKEIKPLLKTVNITYKV